MKVYKYFRSFLVCVLAMLLLLGAIPSVHAKTLSEKLNYKDTSAVSDILFDTYYYSEYLEDNKDVASDSGLTVDVDILSFKADGISPNVVEDSEKGTAIYWGENCNSLSFEVDIEKSDLYEIYVDYYAADGNTQVISRSIKIDGEYLYDEAKNVFLRRFFKDNDRPKTNSLGDQVMPFQEEVRRWDTIALYDNQGLYSAPLSFALTSGKHVITFEYINQPVMISKIQLKSKEKLSAYDEVLAGYAKNGYTAATDTISFEAEDFERVSYKSASSILMGSSSDATITPKGATQKKYNYIGGSSWSAAGDSIVWNFDIKQPGLYKIALRTLQNTNSGMPVYRKIEIDGKVPFSEILEYEFEYSPNWLTHEIGSDGEPYLFYFDVGSHTLKMTAQNGGMTEIIEMVTEANSRLSNCYQNIVMVTGQSPDVNYDYELDKAISSLNDDLSGVSDCLNKAAEMLREITNKTTTLENTIFEVKSNVDSLLKDVDSIPMRLSDFTNSLTKMGDWLKTLKSQSLCVDKIIIATEQKKLDNPKQSIWDRLYNTFINLILSYTKDYSSTGTLLNSDGTEKKELEIWISKSKEWAELLKDLADSEFAKEKSVNLKVNLLPEGAFSGVVNSLLLAVNAGKAPDVVLNMTPANVAEYAVRGAICDLTQFSDFEQTSGYTLKELYKPLTYNGSVYGLPETMDFKVMFYRTDVFEKLNISVPDTWNDVYDVMLPKLYQYNLQMFVPAGLDMFLYQNNGSYYTEDLNQSALNTANAITAFERFIANYNDYGFPYNVSFYNRFRTGELPVGIGGLSDYMSISYAAPELSGKWAIAPVPATIDENGNKNRSVGSLLATTAVILEEAEDKQLAWDFLKWWTSAEIQTEYGQRVESLLGISARWSTANITAFERLPWSTKDISVIKTSWEGVKEIPYVLGGYFTSRHVTNAIARCITGGVTPRDSLEEAYEQINIELERKREDFKVKD